MVTVAALEAIKTGTTTIVENAGGIGRSAAALAQTGLRCVFAESIRDSENVARPMSPDGLARSEAPRFSPRLRDEGLQRITDLFTAWHGKQQGRISVFPAAALAETSSPELLQAVRAFADKHDLGYTIHLSQSVAGPHRHDHFPPGGDGREPGRHPADPSAASGGLPHRQRHR
jgi:cytosine/adenosine deaminase-related metal-dependent hydrolase